MTALPFVAALLWASVQPAFAAPTPTHALASTSDGASVALTRFAATGSPILLVHGLSSNHRSYALEGRGLAHDLHAQGYDVWMLDLRGREASTPAPGSRHWTLDDYGRHDLAAAFDHIRTTTGHPKVAYVGHSMGGMVLAVYHHWHSGDALGPVVVLGSPINFRHPDPMVRVGARSMWAGSWMPKVPSPAAARAASVRRRTPRIDAMVFAPKGTSPATRRAVYQAAVSPMSSGEIRHLRTIVDAGRLVSADGSVDYVDSLEDWKTPLLVVAGRADRIAPSDRVVTWVDATSGPDTTWWVAGTTAGYPYEYGHLDLILADDVAEELHADVLEWLHARPW